MTRAAAIRRLVLLVLATLSCSVLAQVGASDPSSGSMISADDFAAMISALKAAGRTMSPYLLDEGIGLAGIFFGWGLFILIIRLVFGPADPGVKADMFFHFFKAGIVLGMLASWVTYGTGPNQETVSPIGMSASKIASYKMPVSVEDIAVNSFDSLVNGIFDKWAGGGGKEKVFNTVGQSWNMMWKASEKRDQIRDQALAAKTTSSNATQGLVDKVTSKLDVSARLLVWLEKISDKIITFLVWLVVAFLAIILMAVYLFVIYCGDITALLGMFMGPIMVPGLLYTRTEFLFEGWLKFMISAGFFKLIAAWLAMLTMKTVEQIQVVANNMYAKSAASSVSGTAGQQIGNGFMMDGGFFLSLVMTILYMLFAIFLMWQTWRLTDALMRGSAGMFTGAQQAAVVSMSTAGVK